MTGKASEEEAASSWPDNRPAPASVDPDRFRESDRRAGIEVTGDFAPFEQKNDMFCRSRWDPAIRSKAAKDFFISHRVVKARKGDGFRPRDYALRNAAWAVANEFADRGLEDGRTEGFLDPIQPYNPPSEEKAPAAPMAAQTAEIKAIAKLFGADFVGITEYDPRWVYAEKYDFRTQLGRPNDDVDGTTSVIVLGHGMDRSLIETMPSALASAAVGKVYSSEITTAHHVAQYICNLGYKAVATINDTALTIPLAIKAGLGEYGRNQMLITPEFGPRIRFSKIFTDLPLNHDAPMAFGVRQFCDMCQRCAEACPPKALPFGPPRDEGPNRSSIKGVRKWTADCEKCFGYWVKLNSDCAICMRVCPYNRDYSRWTARVWRRLAGTRLRRLMLRIDDRWGVGKRVQPKEWWRRLAALSPAKH